ncbi:MAG: trypsin-like serine peptidase [Trebonia sp.]
MRWMARRARTVSPRARVLTVVTVLITAVAYCAALLLPSNVGAAAVIQAPGKPTPTQSPTISSTGQAFGGVPNVGALFTSSGGKLGTHFCTASVVHSAHGDLAVTAAHCMAGASGQVVFVPGYASGKEPYGVWPVAAVYTDQAWQSSQNPDDDVAFLRLSDSKGGVPIEDVTGAERLGIAWPVPALVRVIGYQDGADQPISCVNWATSFSATQLQFDCDNYTDGTSGAPFLANASGASGQGTVIGVIGGYEQGGDTPDVSYAAAFGAAVAALYHKAEAGG